MPVPTWATRTGSVHRPRCLRDAVLSVEDLTVQRQAVMARFVIQV